MNHLDFALMLRDEAMAGISDAIKAESANDFYLTAEAAKKPRTLGISKMDDTVMVAMWFDEMVCYAKPGGGFHNWWDEDNKPPKGREGKLRHGVDWKTARLPLRSSQSVGPAEIEKFGNEEEARKAAWEQAAKNYGQNTIYKIMRGDSEQWAGGFEPAVFLDQKPAGSDDLGSPDLHLLYLEVAKKQLGDLTEKMIALRQKGKPLSDNDQQLRTWLVGHIKRIMAADITRNHAQFLGDDWRKREVKTSFRGFSGVGREIYQGVQPPIARALSNSRRQQARMMRIIGIEIDEDGSEPSPDSVVYSRMSEAYDINPILTDAILTRSGMNVNKPFIEEVKHRLNEWREMHGLLPIELNPTADFRGGGPQQEQQKGKKGEEEETPEEIEKREAQEAKRAESDAKEEEKKRESFMLDYPPPGADHRSITRDAWNNLGKGKRKDDWIDYYQGGKHWDIMGDEFEDMMKEVMKFWKGKKSSATYGENFDLGV